MNSLPLSLSTPSSGNAMIAAISVNAATTYLRVLDPAGDAPKSPQQPRPRVPTVSHHAVSGHMVALMSQSLFTPQSV